MWIAYGMMFVLGLLSAFLIFIVLLQRGRGGGLAGALGGMGGQSAFGTKAGDVFTKITVILAMVWIVLAAGSIPLMRYLAGGKFQPGSGVQPTITAPPLKGDAPALPGDQPEGEPPADGAGDQATTDGEAKDGKTTDDAQKPEDGDAKSKPTEETKPDAEKPPTEDKPSKDDPAEPKSETKDEPKESPEK